MPFAGVYGVYFCIPITMHHFGLMIIVHYSKKKDTFEPICLMVCTPTSVMRHLISAVIEEFFRNERGNEL